MKGGANGEYVAQFVQEDVLDGVLAVVVVVSFDTNIEFIRSVGLEWCVFLPCRPRVRFRLGEDSCIKDNIGSDRPGVLVENIVGEERI